MKKERIKKLKEAGWAVGDYNDFLELTSEEVAIIELKATLANKLQQSRKRKKMTQVEVANILNTSQSRVAKMEAGDPSVSVDLLIRGLLSLGTRIKTIGNTISSAST